VETKPKIEALWAQYGKLQAQREQYGVALEQLIQQMRQIHAQILQSGQEERK